MMNFLLLILILFSGAIYATAIYNKNPGSYYPATVFSIVLIFLPFYYLNYLNLGIISIIFIASAMILFSIYKIIKDKNSNFTKLFFSNSTIIYFIFICVLYFITKNSYVSLWDELRLWGAYPKFMYFANTNVFGVNSTIYTEMQNYPPAMQVFQFFFAKILASFSDNILFWAYTVFVLSLIVPIFESKSKYRFLAIPFFMAVIYALPQSYFNNIGGDSEYYYTSLFIESALGMLIAYNMFKVFNNPQKDMSKSIAFAVSLTILVMLKESGLFFAILIIVFNVLFNMKEDIKDDKLINYLPSIILPLLFYTAFRYVLKYNGVLETSMLNLENVKNLFFNPSPEQAVYFREFINMLFNSNAIIDPNISKLFGLFNEITPLLALIINSIFVFITILIADKKHKLRVVFINIASLVIIALFFLSMFPIYVYKIANEFDFPSFNRYLNTVLLSQLALNIFIIFSNSFLESSNKRINLLLTSFCLACLLLLFPIGKPQQTGNEWFRKEAESVHTAIENKIENNQFKKLFLIMNNDSGDDMLIHHQLYYLLLKNNINLNNSIFEINWIAEPNIDELSPKLKEYDYMYLYADYEDEFLNNYSSLFVDEVKEGNLYKIENINEELKLKLVE